MEKRELECLSFPTLTSTTDHHLCTPPESSSGLGVEWDEGGGVGEGEEGRGKERHNKVEEGKKK